MVEVETMSKMQVENQARTRDFVSGASKKPWDNGALRVHENGRYFVNGDVPFFWLADTAWLLFHKLDLEETYRYLRNRKEKGYNVILADFLHTSDQKNLAGDSALHDGDFTRVNIDGTFWSHIDRVIEMAEEMGLYMGILPVWGSSIVRDEGSLTMDNMKNYMNFVLNRYHKYPNLIWIAGGDVRGDVDLELFHAMGAMLKADNPERLVTYHPFGRCDSSQWFHEAPWLDFNLFQSGHRRYDQDVLGTWDDNRQTESSFREDCWRYVESDYGKMPRKPTLDGEPSYEWILQGLHDKNEPYWQAADVRRYAYWDVFAGAAGHTYGHNAVMQFQRREEEQGTFGVNVPWDEGIHHSGGAQMKHLKDLMESIDFLHGKPASHYLLSQQGEKYERISVYAGPDYLMAYSYTNRTIKLSLKDYKDKPMAVYWFRPATGVKSYIRTVTGQDEIMETPSPSDETTDIVLLLQEENPAFSENI